MRGGESVNETIDIVLGRLGTRNGKTYLPLLADLDPSWELSASARTTGGHPVPAKVVVPWGFPHPVLVVPALLATIRVSLVVRDASGAKVADRAVFVRPSTAFFQSTANWQNHPSELERYVGLDDAPVDGATFVDLERLYTDARGTELIHGTVELIASDEASLAQPLRTRLLDVFGRRVEAPAMVVMRDATSRLEDGSWLRTIRYSQQIPAHLRSFTYWVRPGSHLVADGFVTVDAPTLAGLRANDDGLRAGRPDGIGYHDWYVHNANKTPLERAARKARAELAGEPPSVSLLIDLAPFDPVGLEETLASLSAQLHERWELVGFGNVAPAGGSRWRGRGWPEAGDESPASAPKPLAMSAADALRRSSGELVGLIDVGDTLEPEALLELAQALREHDGAAFAYADQDFRAEGDAGRSWQLQGTLKTAFDRDLLYSLSATGRPALVKRELLDPAALAARGATGRALDLELALAGLEAGVEPVHVPEILYHKLAASDFSEAWVGFATAPPKESEEERLSEEVLEAHFERIGLAASVEPHPEAPSGRVVSYASAKRGAEGDGERPLVSIVIPSKDSAPVLGRCLDSIRELSTWEPYEIVIVENNSTEPATFAYYEELEADPRVSVVRYEGPFNFSAICNLGARAAKGSILVFLNNDTEVIEPRWLELLAGPLSREDVGATGARLLYPDTLLQHGGVLLQADGPAHVEYLVSPNYDAYLGLSRFHTHQLSTVTGACLAVGRATFDAVGGFDENLPIAYNDIDFCLKIRERGLAVVMEPKAVLWHYESLSRGLDHEDLSKVTRLNCEIGLMAERWPEVFALGDPFLDHRFAYHNFYYVLGWHPSLSTVED